MQFLDPQKVIQHFSIAPDMHVAEFHAGSGYFTPLLREAVGSYGIVHSFQYDEKQDTLTFPELVDRVIIINLPMMPMCEDAHQIFSKAYRILKPTGKIIFIDRAVGHISPERATDIAGITGFTREKHFHTGDHHFGLVFKKG